MKQKKGETISFETLKSLIIDNPFKEAILRLHQIEYGTPEYCSIKKSMPVVTPHCIFTNNGDKKNDNVDSFSGYFYFDIDAKDITGDVEGYKKTLIAKIGDKVCLLGKSIGGRGLFFYVKVEGVDICNQNFKNIRDAIIDKYFNDIPIDKKCCNANRLQFLPYDDNLFYSEVEVSFNNIDSNSFTYSQSINSLKTHCILRMGEKYTPINELLSKYIFETKVEVESSDYDVKPVVDYKKIFIPKVINDGYKHKCFSTIVNQLIRLNESITEFDLISYLNYINKNHTNGQPMKHSKLENLVRNVYKETKLNGLMLGKIKTKNIHFNKQTTLSRYEKVVIANKENGVLRKSKSQKLILDAIKELTNAGFKITQVNVAKILEGRLSRGPIEKYWRIAIAENKKLPQAETAFTN